MQKLTAILLFIAGVVFGLVVARGGQVAAQERSRTHYEVIGTARDTSLERELNEKATQGCKPILTVGAGYTEAMIILECPDL